MLNKKQRDVVLKIATIYSINPGVVAAYLLIQHKHYNLDHKNDIKVFGKELNKNVQYMEDKFESLDAKHKTNKMDKTTLSAQALYDTFQNDETKFQSFLKLYQKIINQETVRKALKDSKTTGKDFVPQYPWPADKIYKNILLHSLTGNGKVLSTMDIYKDKCLWNQDCSHQINAAHSGEIQVFSNSYMRINHESGYSTAYNLMKNLRSSNLDGHKVQKGQPIGNYSNVKQEEYGFIRYQFTNQPHLEITLLYKGRPVSWKDSKMSSPTTPPMRIIPSEYFQFDPALKAYPWTDIIHSAAPSLPKEYHPLIMQVAERHHINPLLVVPAVITRMPYYTKHGKKHFQELLEKDMSTLGNNFHQFIKDPKKGSQRGSPLSTAIWTTLGKNEVDYLKYIHNLEGLQKIMTTVQPTQGAPVYVIPSQVYDFQPGLKAYPWRDIVQSVAPSLPKDLSPVIMEVAERHHISPLLVATAVVTRLPHYTKHGKKHFKELLDKDMTTLAHHFQLFKKDPTKHRQMGSPLSTAIWMTLNKNNVEYQKFVQNLIHLQNVLLQDAKCSKCP